MGDARTRTLAIILAVLGCVVMVYRGPMRSLAHGGYDGALVYAAARAWLEGGNPYEAEPVSKAWMSGGGDPAHDPMKARTREVLLYPPTALAIVSPWAVLPWRAAMVAGVLLNTAFMVAAVLAAAALGGFVRGTVSWWWAVAAGMWLAPFHTCIVTGQTANLGTLCIVAGLLARMRGRSGGGGVLLGVAAAMKPQLGALFLVYEAGRLRWRVVGWGVAVIVALTVVGVGRMEVGEGGGWRQSWLRNVGEFAATGDGRPTTDNPLRNHLVNLHFPLHEFTDNREVVKWMVYGVVGALCAAYAWVDWRARRRGRPERGGDELVSLSMVAVATLLVVYHRFYDAAVLILPAMMALRETGWRRWVPLALLLPIFANSAVGLVELAKRGVIPAGITGNRVWEVVVVPHQVWGLLAIGLCLVVMRRSSRSVDSASSAKAIEAA